MEGFYSFGVFQNFPLEKSEFLVMFLLLRYYNPILTFTSRLSKSSKKCPVMSAA